MCLALSALELPVIFYYWVEGGVGTPPQIFSHRFSQFLGPARIIFKAPIIFGIKLPAG